MTSWNKKDEKRLVLLVNRRLSNREIAKRLNKSLESVDSKIKRIRSKYSLKPRRERTDNKLYKFDTSCLLDAIGLTLYWSEGSKRPNRIVEFVNSDPHTIAIFMKFLRQAGIYESRLRARVKIYAFQNLGKCVKFWSEITGIPVTQFQKPIIRDVAPKRNHFTTDYGTLTIRYHSLSLFKIINNSVNQLKSSLL